MAKCSTCRREVGCSCNLIQGQCAKCFAESGYGGGTITYSTQTVTQTTSDQPNMEFENILNTQGISQEEKLRRINAILEQARLEANDTNI